MVFGQMTEGHQRPQVPICTTGGLDKSRKRRCRDCQRCTVLNRSTRKACVDGVGWIYPLPGTKGDFSVMALKFGYTIRE